LVLALLVVTFVRHSSSVAHIVLDRAEFLSFGRFFRADCSPEPGELVLQNALLAPHVQHVGEEERPGHDENGKQVTKAGFKFALLSFYDRNGNSVFRRNGDWRKSLLVATEPTHNFDGFFALG
jgi:hypothetical protein